MHCAPQGSSDAAWKMKPQGTSLPRHRGGTVWDPDRYNPARIPLGFLLGVLLIFTVISVFIGYTIEKMIELFNFTRKCNMTFPTLLVPC